MQVSRLFVWAGNTPKKSPTEGSVGEGSHLGKGEGKFGKTVLAGDGDVLFVGVEQGLDDVQPQAHPVLVGGASQILSFILYEYKKV